MYDTKHYHYTLPKELIAQTSIHPHHDARLMVVERETGTIIDESTFWNIGSYIGEDRVLFFNNTRVLKARIRLKNIAITKPNGEKDTLDEGEILYLENVSEHTFHALVRPGKKFKIGTKISLGGSTLEVLHETDSGRILGCEGVPISQIMENYGELPLPPYIEYSKEKEGDYQTCFSEKDGSVAAPTASLHFTEELLTRLPHEKRFLTLHVGLGTFKGVDTSDVRDYKIHEEVVEIGSELFAEIAVLAKSRKKILAVGTTACRTLESLPHFWKSMDDGFKESLSEEVFDFWEEKIQNLQESLVSDIEIHGGIIRFKTKIYIYPGIPFRIIDELITNFHLPESSLLLLVGAFVSQEKIMNIYQEAIKKQYRFFSFGDGMYIRTKS